MARKTTLTCNQCGQDKPADEYHWRNTGAGVKHRVCNDCVSQANAQRYESNRDVYLGRVQARRAETRAAFDAYAASHGCVDCGEQRSPALTLDALVADAEQPSRLLSNQTWSSVASTIGTQYAVRCLNCQAVRKHTAVADSSPPGR